MKVTAFLVTYGRPVGADLMSRALLEALADAGHEVTVYLDAETEAREERGVRLLPRSEFRLGQSVGDAVYTHADHGSVAWLASGGGRVPLVYAVHNVQAGSWHGLTHYPPALVVWNAHATREAHQGPEGIVVRSPLRVADYAAPKGARRDAVTLVNLYGEKGAPVFYDLAERFPGVPFLGVRGGYGDQDERPGLAEIVGPVAPEEMRSAVYARTRVLLVPSRTESWGRVAVEALCSGIPVVAAPTPGLREALGPAGTFVDPEDRDGWAEALRALLEDPKTYAAASRRARARAKALEAETASDLTLFVEAMASLV